MVYIMRDLVPDEPAVPWGLHDPLPPPDSALPAIPLTSCDAHEHGEHVRL